MQEKLARLRAELAQLTSSVEDLSGEHAQLHDHLGHATLSVDHAQTEVSRTQKSTKLIRDAVIECNSRLVDAADGVSQSLLQPAFLSGGTSCGEASCCIVSTLKGVCLEELTTWISHHIDSCGFVRAFLFFDEPSELVGIEGALAPWADRVVATSVDERLQSQYASCSRYETLRPRLEEDWLARQELHVEIAMRWAHAANTQWLLHIDLDELFVLDEGTAPQHFGSVPGNIDNIRYLNHEGIPVLGEPSVEESLRHNRFAAVQLFRRNPQCFGDSFHLKDLLPRISGYKEVDDVAWEKKLDSFLVESGCESNLDSQAAVARRSFAFWLERTKLSLGRAQYFLAYANGKGAVRLGSAALPCGVHGFGSQEDACVYWTPCEVAVLHYANGSFEAFADKMQRLQASNGAWWKRFALYSKGRDTDHDCLDYIYRHAIALDANDANEVARQVQSGICFRYVAQIPDSYAREGERISFLSELD